MKKNHQSKNILTALLSLLALFMGPKLAQTQVCLGIEQGENKDNSEEVIVEVKASGFKEVAGVQLSILFDTLDYEFIALAEHYFPGNSSFPFSVNAGGTYGVIRVAWSDLSLQGISIDDDSPLFSFKFKHKTENLSPFIFSNEPLSIEIFEPDLYPLSVANCKTGEPLVQYLRGQIIFDEDEDCQISENDRIATLSRNWKNWNNRASQTGRPKFSGFLKEDGSYSLRLFEGENLIEPIPPSPYYEFCTPPFSINTNDDDLEKSYETLVQIKEYCPYMQINLSALPANPCEESLLSLRYQNNGTVDAEAAYFEIDFDYRLEIKEILGGTLIDLGNNKYRKEVGKLPYGGSGSIFFVAQVPCDISPEEVLCHEARIFPNEICGVNSTNWSGASLKVEGQCDEEEVKFEIKNIGTGDMIEPLEFVVIEDAVIFRTGQLQLEQGASETISLAANGASYYVQIPQEKGHPGESKPSAFLEACGRDENGNFSTGFSDLFPKNEKDFFVDVTCQPLTDRFTSGVMRATPLGFQAEHFIEPDDFINYKIFFNRGVLPITIIDSLSTFLDVSTFEVVETGLTYLHEINNNILRIDIEPREGPGIANEFNSFIAFKIKPKKNIASNSRITNTATIYEDGEIPLRTNTVFHTVKPNFLQRITSVTKTLQQEQIVTIFPNPSNEIVHFNLKTPNVKPSELIITDINGRKVTQVNFVGAQYQFKRGELPAGTYLYQFFSNEGKVDNGFFILID